MEQRARGIPGHARIAVGRARRHALEQYRDGAHARAAVERVDEMDLARPRIGETDIDARLHERTEQAFSAVQENLLFFPKPRPPRGAIAERGRCRTAAEGAVKSPTPIAPSGASHHLPRTIHARGS